MFGALHRKAFPCPPSIRVHDDAFVIAYDVSAWRRMPPDTTDAQEVAMKTFANVVLGVAVGCAVASLVIHRRVVAAIIKREPLPEPPAWHVGHPCLKK